MSRKRAQQFDDIPMFDAVPVAVPEPAKQRAAGSAWCPGCRFSRKAAVGVLVVGEHLVYREHTKPTWSGAPVTCPPSGVRLCQARPTDKHDGRVTACTCEKEL